MESISMRGQKLMMTHFLDPHAKKWALHGHVTQDSCGRVGSPWVTGGNGERLRGYGLLQEILCKHQWDSRPRRHLERVVVLCNEKE
jgi:hypothetical protein